MGCVQQVLLQGVLVLLLGCEGGRAMEKQILLRPSLLPGEVRTQQFLLSLVRNCLKNMWILHLRYQIHALALNPPIILPN